jgi:D-Tyr-tRNAtyr deacylase
MGGVFGARMAVEILNDGPVTIILEVSSLSSG